ncbi:MAG: vitamin K epoxide reductase family protein [Patescibacteria group bacterium]|nr:vitamin K epoxide reductase family protein [Patescibacteria group bacterium]MDE2588503.1 vitamin K epoxide reductase family protein [Patescibacteria group bacterium]
MKTTTLWKAVLVLASVGIMLAVYLLWEQLFHPLFQPCNINQTINCNAIINGPVSLTFGIPTPLYGLIGYIVMFGAAMYTKRKLLLFTVTFGLLFCLWIAYQELLLLHVICPVCILCQLDMLSVFTLAVVLNKRK